MKKLYKIKESQLKKVIENIIKEGLELGTNTQGFVSEETPEREIQRKKTMFRKREFEPYKREEEIKSLFGPYADDIPPQVYQHLRKNPQQFINKFREIYGKKY